MSDDSKPTDAQRQIVRSYHHGQITAEQWAAHCKADPSLPALLKEMQRPLPRERH